MYVNYFFMKKTVVRVTHHKFNWAKNSYMTISHGQISLSDNDPNFI